MVMDAFEFPDKEEVLVQVKGRVRLAGEARGSYAYLLTRRFMYPTSPRPSVPI
jgi:hypothetical protein